VGPRLRAARAGRGRGENSSLARGRGDARTPAERPGFLFLSEFRSRRTQRPAAVPLSARDTRLEARNVAIGVSACHLLYLASWTCAIVHKDRFAPGKSAVRRLPPTCCASRPRTRREFRRKPRHEFAQRGDEGQARTPAERPGFLFGPISLRIVKNHPQRMPSTLPHPAHPVPHVHAINPARALYRPLAHRKDHRAALA